MSTKLREENARLVAQLDWATSRIDDLEHQLARLRLTVHRQPEARPVPRCELEGLLKNPPVCRLAEYLQNDHERRPLESCSSRMGEEV